MKTPMSVLLFLKRSRTNKYHLLPIYMRVTINGRRFEIATHINVASNHWSQSGGVIKGHSAFTSDMNTELDLLKKQVYDYRERILAEGREFTVDTLREKWFGLDRSKLTLLEVTHDNIVASELLVKKGIYRKSTLIKYLTTEKHLKAFIKWRNLGKDIFLKDLRIGFIFDFQYYMEAEKGLSINSAGRMVKNLKKIVRDCVNKDWLDKDPFANFKVKHIDPKVPHLTSYCRRVGKDRK